MATSDEAVAFFGRRMAMKRDGVVFFCSRMATDRRGAIIRCSSTAKKDGYRWPYLEWGGRGPFARVTGAVTSHRSRPFQALSRGLAGDGLRLEKTRATR